MMLDLKVVKIDSKIIISLRLSKSVTHSVVVDTFTLDWFWEIRPTWKGRIGINSTKIEKKTMSFITYFVKFI